MPADTSEKGLETRTINLLQESGWLPGENQDYAAAYRVDLVHLAAFLHDTQPETAQALHLDQDDNTRRQFLQRLQRQIRDRGIIDVLRNGVQHQQHSVRLFYGTPSPGNQEAAALNTKNRFSVTRQVHYSAKNPGLSLDLVIFINGLPILTFELKNNLTKQTGRGRRWAVPEGPGPPGGPSSGPDVAHPTWPWTRTKYGSAPSSPVRSPSSCPSTRGTPMGAPATHQTPRASAPTTSGRKPSHLRVSPTSSRTTPSRSGGGRSGPATTNWRWSATSSRTFPRTGSGTATSSSTPRGAGSPIPSPGWPANSSASRRMAKPSSTPPSSSPTGVVLDSQITDTVRQFTQVVSTVGHAESSADLRRLITEGKRIIITTVQKFPFVAEAMAEEHLGRNFAIIIDEAHSSQGGRTASAMHAALGPQGEQDEEDYEDQINRIIESRRMLDNASYFAFTATPKNKTLELFGGPSPQPDGTVKHIPFHVYSMKQAIQEGFILDVLQNYTSIQSYFNLIKKIDDDPEFDSTRAQRRLRHYVEGHETAIRSKAEIIVDHFNESIFTPQLQGTRARAMVVTDGVDRAIDYYLAMTEYIQEKEFPFRPIIAFSGEREHSGKTVSEPSLNHFPSAKIPEMIQEDPYRILICADKFQTGYDEPLLSAMYVDKTLAGIRAVQTLSRLNRPRPTRERVRPGLHEQPRGHPEVLRGLLPDDHPLRGDGPGQASRPEGDSGPVPGLLLGAGRPVRGSLPERGRPGGTGPQARRLRGAVPEAGRGRAGGVQELGQGLRAPLLLPLPGAALRNANWEKLSIFLGFLVNKLPAPKEEDLSRGVLDAVDMESYRMERRAAQSIGLLEEDAEISPIQSTAAGGAQESEMDLLSNIIAEFYKTWGGKFSEPERISEVLNRMPEQVLEDQQYQNARMNSGRQNAQIELDSALRRLVTSMVRCQTELYKAYTEDGSSGSGSMGRCSGQRTKTGPESDLPMAGGSHLFLDRLPCQSR